MDSDTELPEDEEEILVYVEFEGFVNNNIFTNGEQLDIIGIDTDHPIMQIDGKFYEGTYEDAIGTYMFFDKDDKPIINDPVFDQVPTLKYFGKTRKVLKMQRVFVKQRVEVLGDSDNSKCIPNIDTIKEAGIPPMYQSEALFFWNDLRDKRINALCAYLEKQKIREEKKSQGIEVNSESDEDSPFAIYKYKEEMKDNQNLENSNIKSSDDTANSSTSKQNNPEKVIDNTLEHTQSKPSTSLANDSFADTNGKVHKPTKVANKKKVFVKGKAKRKCKKKSTVVEDEFIQNNNDLNTESTLLMLDEITNDSTKNIESNNPVNIVQDITNNVDVKDNLQADTKIKDIVQANADIKDNEQTNADIKDNEQANTDIKDNKQANTDINTDISMVETQVKTTDDTKLDTVKSIIDKRHAKLLKREAKMKELTEKLKSLIESTKANMNQ
ncbi:hypothetical protein M0802_012836 [Mischocyttarus mexicanus]|nr:hypothetical protein M0802_012836 [Mischocyttarus mexicanus]